MYKGQKIIWGGLALLLLIGTLIGCGTPTSATGLTPTTISKTPTPPPMVRVTIQLDYVTCNGKQSVWWFQQDKFYMLTTFVASGPTPTSPVVSQSHLSDIVIIGNHQTLPVPPGPLVVFNALLPLDGYIKGGFTGYNGGVSDTQSAQFVNWGLVIGGKVADQLHQEAVDSENLTYEISTTIIDIGVHAFYDLLNSNTQNPTELGRQPLERTSNGAPVDEGTLPFAQKNGPGGTWNYVVHYTITRTIVNGTS